MPTTYFSSADAGTNKTGYAGIKGATGDLVKVLNSTLILDTGFTETGASTFADATNAWMQMGAGTALFVANNATTDRAYFGGRQKFSQLIMKFATAGIGGTCTYEYWNGSAWTALVGSSDGTSGLTADGTLSFAAASQTGWTQVAVNSVTLFWIRVQWATTYSTNPVLKLGSVYGWGSPHQGTNGATYRSQLTSGVQHYVNVNDDGPGAGTGKEARVFGAEALTQYNTTPNGGTGITGPFPTVAQATNGIFVRKSADATTARTWRVLMDEKTFYLFILTGDSAGVYICALAFGEFFSLVSGDLYRSMIAARGTENSATVTGNSAGLYPLCNRAAQQTAFATTGSSMYIPRNYLGAGSATLIPLFSGMPGAISNAPDGGLGTITIFNNPDGGLISAPVFIGETTGSVSTIRGRLRGIWDWGHVAGGVADQDVFSGNGALAAKTFVILLNFAFRDVNGNVTATGVVVAETSNTWEVD